jgi:uncharacterized membrane protein (DUF106 family)
MLLIRNPVIRGIVGFAVLTSFVLSWGSPILFFLAIWGFVALLVFTIVFLKDATRPIVDWVEMRRFNRNLRELQRIIDSNRRSKERPPPEKAGGC